MRILAMSVAVVLATSGAAFAQSNQSNPRAQGQNQNYSNPEKQVPASEQGQKGISKAKPSERGRERGRAFASP